MDTSSSSTSLSVAKLVKRGLLALLLIGSSTAAITTKTSTSLLTTSKPSLVVTKSPSSALYTPPGLVRDVTNDDDTNCIDITIPRGGDGDEANGMAHSLKVGSYFAIWYILNIVYNSE